ncbi:valine--tRNA ligase [endosymbiont of Sipalinus gigas]|uniref:valine--tRNA ligase n=1 Tax=endosymbiont of Sipalinus gigas TaxID=1972134 RepID=UPI000DC70E0D|nr:valine--tRNA ligase [endosymbiont of Sipalinus gigas]BBA85341.1 valine--tRNA ligase [endosymbiont of Sipalinus gigas]
MKEEKYNPKNFENEIYKIWEKNFNYKNINYEGNNNFSIIIPPLNINGKLHIGHSLQYYIIDTLIRYNRMIGKKIYNKFGLDHAGIATQIFIEKNNNTKDKSILIKKSILLKKKIKKSILKQIEKLGLLINKDKYRFTLDNHYKYSVSYAFIKMYNDNLIYKDRKMVNWDFKINSAISDLEIENIKTLSKIWYIKYFILKNKEDKIDINKYIIIATTRPETILGDSAVGININDNRFYSLKNNYAVVPIVNRIVPIIFDKSIDILKFTGCIKITPSHDFNDYNIGIKYNLSFINIFDDNGKINNILKIYKNNIKYYENTPNIVSKLDINKAREVIVNELYKLNLIYLVENKYINIPVNSRTMNIIEPIITTQWFLKTKKISENLKELVKNNEIKFYPKKYENIYFKWIDNIKDWCISRQIWWGHKIPVWYDIKNNIYLGYNEKYVRNKYKLGSNIHIYQDKNVLDTWFSSGLWSFVSLGWPNKLNNFKKISPYNIVISGFDIIFFWISRMILLSNLLIKDNLKIPFKEIYLTCIINDKFGNKISKSNNNIINPIDIINGNFKENTKKYYIGSDCLRLNLLSFSNIRNIKLKLDKTIIYRNFCNKIWNASKFIYININSNIYIDFLKYSDSFKEISIYNIWIILEFKKVLLSFNKFINNYRLDLIINLIYNFVWNTFCNYYLEFSKYFLYYSNNELIKEYYINTLFFILNSILKLSHPFIPFITEKIWQFFIKKLNIDKKNIILNEKFPDLNLYEKLLSKNNSNLYKLEYNINFIINLINIIRKIKISINKIYIYLLENSIKILIFDNLNLIKKISKINDIILINDYSYNLILINIDNILINKKLIIYKDKAL